MTIGAFIGSAPRSFVYTALGALIGDLSSPLASSAVAVWFANRNQPAEHRYGGSARSSDARKRVVEIRAEAGGEASWTDRAGSFRPRLVP
jgi:hypothetical protein